VTISKRNLLVGLDTGSSSIKAALGEILSNGTIHILGLVKNHSEGVRKGNIIDIEGTARSIDQCLNELERLTGVEISSALTGFSGTSITAVRNHAVVAVGNSNYEITQEDKDRVLQSAKNIALPPDKAIVQVIERQYIVDGYDGVKDPVGMVGSRLEVEVLILIAATAALQNLQRSADRINLHLDGLVYNQLMAAEAVLLPAEMQMGVILVDMGSGTTEISIFWQGNLLFTSVLPIGGEYITRDLAIVLKTSIEEAGKIKENFGVASPVLAREENKIKVHSLQGKETEEISQYIVAEIISSRVMEMTEMICAEINQYHGLEKLPGGIVLTGGGALLTGIAEAMESFCELPVRVGFPERVKGLDLDVMQPDNAVVLGSLMYGLRHTMIAQLEMQQNVSSVFQRINNWFKDLFS